MHGPIRFPTSRDDFLVAALMSLVAAIAEREARSIGSLNISSMTGVLLVQGDEAALASLAARLESLGVSGQALRVEVEGTEDKAQDVAEFIRGRTDLMPVVAVAVQSPAT